METLELSSLIVFNSTNLSLNKPSLLWLFAGSNSFEVSKRWFQENIPPTTTADPPTVTDIAYCLAETCIERKGDVEPCQGAPLWLMVNKNQKLARALSSNWGFHDNAANHRDTFCSWFYGWTPNTMISFATFISYKNVHQEREIMFDRWPGDHGRKQPPLNRDILSRKSQNLLQQSHQTNHYSFVGSMKL